MNMIDKIVGILGQHKMYTIIAIAALMITAYALPYGMDVEAKKGDNPGRHYGLVQGEGYGLNCSQHKTGTGPLPCR